MRDHAVQERESSPLTTLMELRERDLGGESLSHYMRRLYYQEDLTMREVAARLRINEVTAWKWMRRLGIAPKVLAPPPGAMPEAS